MLPTHTVWDRGRVGVEADWTEAWVVLSQRIPTKLEWRTKVPIFFGDMINFQFF